MAQVARDLGLDDNLVSRWKKEAQENGPRAFPGQGHPQDEELARLRRENDVLRQEREVLPSAISIFSATTRRRRLGKRKPWWLTSINSSTRVTDVTIARVFIEI
jgi:transposase